MAVIYLTGITIAMLNITGIGFVIFMILFTQHSGSKLKKATFRKKSIAKDTIQNGIDKVSTSEKRISSPGSDQNRINRTVSANQGLPTAEKISTPVVNEVTIASVTAATALGAAASTNATGTGTGESSGNTKRSDDFDNIDDILDDLDLSDFDDLNLDDFN